MSVKIRKEARSACAFLLPPRSSLKRIDIQALRAVAVIGVFLFHAGFPIKNGYLGVDVFFCISGYLISGLLFRKGRTTRKVALEFLMGRAQRLIPPYLVLLLFTAVAVLLLTIPEISKVAVMTAMMGIIFSANIYIAGIASDYFGPNANNNALLHLWTLSAEWQMYFLILLLYALLSIKACKIRRWALTVIIFTSIISLSLWWFAQENPNVSWGHLSRFISYYGIGTRFWEFGVGGACSLICKGNLISLGTGITNLIRGTSWSVIPAIFVIPTNSNPTTTILLIIATASILITEKKNLGTQKYKRASNIFNAIGDYSYSIYLWHWPFIVLAKLLYPGNGWIGPVAAILSLIPATLSGKFIENNFRDILKNRINSYSPILLSMFTTVIILLLSMQFINHFQSQKLISPRVIVDGDTDPIHFQEYLAEKYPRCSDPEILQNAIRYKEIIACQQSFSNKPIDVAILGDSHAQQLFLAMTLTSPEKNFTYFTTDEGLPVTGDPNAQRILKYLFNSKSIQDIYISARWEVRGVPISSLARSLSPLARDGRNIFIFDDLPTFPTDVNFCKYETIFTKQNICEMESKYFFEIRNGYLPALERVAKNIPNASIVKFPNFVCDEELCKMSRDNKLIFRDSNHLTHYGASLLGEYVLSHNKKLRENLLAGIS